MSITIFSRSVGGYNRHEVDEYIAGLNRAYNRSQREYEKKIEVLEAQLERMKEKVTESESDKALIETQKKELSERRASQNEADTESESDAKSRRYDEISRRLGEILINANAEASAMLREADERVTSTLTDTTAQIESELSALAEKLRALSASAHERLSLEPKDGEDA